MEQHNRYLTQGQGLVWSLMSEHRTSGVSAHHPTYQLLSGIEPPCFEPRCRELLSLPREQGCFGMLCTQLVRMHVNQHDRNTPFLGAVSLGVTTVGLVTQYDSMQVPQLL
jgi:hypothetical protein